ncbi:glycosyltransferase [Clostridium sp. 19966]|uniref:glycosyltransferase n=1 Tax=Clostridium sp. 19966 TaxID=2768166 RepID=UPI0028DFC6E7|nr:glycosyltransferase [Clostridium sp. 19966]MDT8717970.1 glycosyltransferase [Clostridium sp. 19966]
MFTLSLCMIVRNEEDVIERCLDSVKELADEIIIVDTGSKDNTLELLKAYDCEIYHFKWIYDFSAARNYSFSKATKDYIMWLDADDIIEPADKIKLLDLKASLDSAPDIMMLKYNVGFDENGNVNFSYFRERIIKRTSNLKWIDRVHEYISPTGQIMNVDIAVTHKKVHPSEAGRNLKIYEKMLSDGVTFSARNLYYYARELYYSKEYEKASDKFQQFLELKEGWVEDKIGACFNLSNCYKELKELEKSKNTLIKSFQFDTPRAEICCELGLYYLNKGDYDRAIDWYTIATTLKPPENSWGFILYDYWNFIPWIQLCVCYYKKGNIEESIRCNKKASVFKPNDPSIIYNNAFFDSLKSH